jgi:hypothetical protein
LGDPLKGNLLLLYKPLHLEAQHCLQEQTRAYTSDFTTRNGGISNNIHQVCVIITEAVEDNDVADNTVVNTQINNPRSNSRKEKIYVSTGEWRVIMSAIKHGTEVPTDSRREVLMGYQYALHQHKKRLREEKCELRRSRENNNASSRSYQDEYSEMSGSSKERHREPKHSWRRTAQPREKDRAWSISEPLSEEEEDFIQETP